MNHEIAAEHLVYLYRRGISGPGILTYAEWLSQQFSEHGIKCRESHHYPISERPLPPGAMSDTEALEHVREILRRHGPTDHGMGSR